MGESSGGGHAYRPGIAATGVRFWFGKLVIMVGLALERIATRLISEGEIITFPRLPRHTTDGGGGGGGGG